MKYLRTPEGRMIAVNDDVADEIGRNGGIIRLQVPSIHGERMSISTPGFEVIWSIINNRPASQRALVALAATDGLDGYTIARQLGFTDFIPISQMKDYRDTADVKIAICTSRHDASLGDMQITITPSAHDEYRLAVFCRWDRGYSECVTVDVNGLLVSL